MRQSAILWLKLMEDNIYYGQLFYQEGDFRKTIEIIEPIVVDYQSYPYTPKLLSCFNLMGVAEHCETEYNVSRFLYETALKIAKENSEKYYYAFETGVKQYHADEIVPDDVVRCAATLYYKLRQTGKYENYKQQILSKMGDMYAAEFMDACKELFACGMDSNDDALIMSVAEKITTVFPEAKCYRFGGDEFVILSFDKTEDMFNDKRKRLAGLWEEGCSASIGSVWLERAKEIEKSVAVADEMMYMNKNSYYEKIK